MKKKILWSIVCILLLLIGGTVLFMFIDLPKDGTLNVNGSDITTDNVVIYNDFAGLPLTEVMEGLGMNVDWLDNNIARITYNDRIYILNLKEVSLVEDKNDHNLLWPAPGAKDQYFKVLDRELIVDDVTIECTFFLMGKKISINFNRKEQIVYVVERTD